MVLAVLSYKYLKNVHPEGHRELMFNGRKQLVHSAKRIVISKD
jgi:hypothetical protein